MFQAQLRGRWTFSDVAGHAKTVQMAPRAGFEPATIRLTVECSTAELPRNRRNQVRAPAYNKALKPCKGRNILLWRPIKRRGELAVTPAFAVPYGRQRMAGSRLEARTACPACALEAALKRR